MEKTKKIMTQEKKAKAYDDALERAKKIHSEIVNNELIGFPGQIEYIFPELRESEDEKVRKALIDGVRQIRCKNGITQEQMISYLEKQKKSLHIPETRKENANSFTDEDEKIRKEIISALKFANDGGVYDKHITYLEKQKGHHYTKQIMTLGDLIRKARECGDKFNTYDVPIYGKNGHILDDVEFEIEQYDSGDYYVNMTLKEK